MSAIIYNKMSEKHACLIDNKNWKKKQCQHNQKKNNTEKYSSIFDNKKRKQKRMSTLSKTKWRKTMLVVLAEKVDVCFIKNKNAIILAS